ncbi:MAG: hypothetical protein SF162_02000 [bacterium]|nr:hypothetical protein [bacterium]
MKVRVVIAFTLVIVLALFVFPVAAHEGREVGDYLLYFGWRNEPAYAGLFNGPEVFIEMHHAEGDGAEHNEAGFPEDIPVSLQAEVTFGSETLIIPLEAAFGTTGHYLADVIPTLPGDYTFRVFGTIGDIEVDETFTSADGEFSSVLPTSDVLFPSAGAVDVAALLARIEALELRLAEIEGS